MSMVQTIVQKSSGGIVNLVYDASVPCKKVKSFYG